MEDFVPFELAKKLKEKGFNEVCYNYYEPLKHCLNQIKTPWTNKEGESYGVITAPIISQVLKWLREKKRIDAGALWNNTDSKWVGYIVEMDMLDVLKGYIASNTYDSYELAVIALIKYVIDNNLI